MTALGRLPAVVAAGVVAAAVGVLLAHSSVSAHTPHDNIAVVVASPDFATTSTVYAVSQGRVLRSFDGGARWQTLATDLPRVATTIATSVADRDTLYLGTETTVFRSTDGGDSWLAAAGGFSGTVRSLVTSPADPDTALLTDLAGGLYRTTDGGGQWSLLPDLGGAVTVEFATGEDGLVVVGDRRGRVSISDDAGASWSEPRSAIADDEVSALLVTDRTDLVVGGADGELVRFDEQSDSFLSMGSGLPDERIMAIDRSPDFRDDGVMWASTWSTGSHRSDDRGETWTARTDGLTTDRQAEAVGVPDFRGLDVAIGPAGDTVLFLAGFDGLFRSDDEMATWQSREVLSEVITGIAISPAYAEDETVAVATYVKGPYLSDDDGQSWTLVDRGLEPVQATDNAYLPVIRLHNIVFSPDYAQDGTLFSSSWTHLLKSSDRGATWSQHVVSDPPADTKLRQFIVALSPRFATDQTVFLGSLQGEVFISNEGGEEGTFVALGSVGGPVRSLAVGPDYPDDPTLCAGTRNGTFVSIDGGRTWEASGPAGVSLLAVSPHYGQDGTVFSGSEAGLWVTRDRGQTWSIVAGD
ncbi:MAG: WD40/YVTN/BNR-like repeat-containing protein, partial [Acidimicrobiales bacterium]